MNWKVSFQISVSHFTFHVLKHFLTLLSNSHHVQIFFLLFINLKYSVIRETFRQTIPDLTDKKYICLTSVTRAKPKEKMEFPT